MAMGETVEELYHQVSADPSSAGISDFSTIGFHATQGTSPRTRKDVSKYGSFWTR
jgi:hypothetical protein